MVGSELVRRMNEGYARLRLEAARIEELPIEVEQLRKAIEVASAKVDFDIDPYDFQAALLELSAGAGK